MNAHRVLLPRASPVTQRVACPTFELSTRCDVITGANGSMPLLDGVLLVRPEALAASNRYHTRPPGGPTGGTSALTLISASPVKVPTVMVFAPVVKEFSGP